MSIVVKMMARPWSNLFSRLILAMLFSSTMVMAVPSAAQAGGACSFIPDPTLRIACEGLSTATGAIGVPGPDDVVGAVGNAIVTPMIQEITKLEVEVMTTTFKQVVERVNEATTPSLEAPWYKRQLAYILGAAVPLGLLALLIRLKQASSSGDASEALVGIGTFIAFLWFAGMLTVIVGLVTAALDGFVAPKILNLTIGDLKEALNSNRVDFTKSVSLTNNPLTPILEPAFFGMFGWVGAELTLLLFTIREIMLYILVAAEAVVMAIAVSGRWGQDAFFRCTMALTAWVLLKVVMAIILSIVISMILAPDTVAIIMGAVGFMALPLLGWGFVKAMASHRIAAVSGALNISKSALRSLPGVG
jgi:hypothetical protein